MNKIFKYEIAQGHGEETILNIPKGEFLSVGEQNGKMFAWFLIYPDEAPDRRVFLTLATGQGFNPETWLKYLSSCNMYFESMGGYYVVWHVFEVIKNLPTAEAEWDQAIK